MPNDLKLKIVLSKDEWIERFVINIMSNQGANKYDHNCYVGWRDKEVYMEQCDALTLAKEAYKRKIKYEQENK